MKKRIIAVLAAAAMLTASAVPASVSAEGMGAAKTTDEENAKSYKVGTVIEQDNLVFVVYDKEDPRLTVKRWDVDYDEVEIPETVDGLVVDAISSSAFDGKKNLKKVTLPSTIREIDSYAFHDCTSLRSINLHSGIESMGSLAFSGCKKLGNVRLSRNLSYIGEALFQACGYMDSISVPGSLENVSGHLGQMITHLYTLRFCSGVKKIVSDTSLNNYYQKRIIIPPSAEELEPHCVGYRYEERDYAGITDAVIYGAKGSAAERYARENGIPFYDFDFKYGDLDNNGKINAVDASLVLYEYTLRGTGDGKGRLSGASELKADLNDDFVINAVDASIILQYYAAISSGSDYTPEEFFFCS